MSTTEDDQRHDDEEKLWRLDSARRTILDFLPEPIRKLLVDAIKNNQTENILEWESLVVGKLIEIAAQQSGNPRAGRCPLCGKSPSSNLRRSFDGFFLPDGLRAHLRGSESEEPCGVMVAMMGHRNDLENLGQLRKASSSAPDISPKQP